MKFSRRAAATLWGLATASAINKPLRAGEIFTLRTLHPGAQGVHERVVRVYEDGTLGIQYDDAHQYPEFHGVLMPEYGIILQPDPLRSLKGNSQGILHLNDALWFPETGFSADNGVLRLKGRNHLAICPSHKNVLFLSNPNANNTLCSDSILVDLQYVSLSV